MNKLLSLCVLSIVCSVSYSAPQVTYVGDGRYTCSGSRAECLPVERQNEMREQRREQERFQREMLEESRRHSLSIDQLRNTTNERNERYR